MDPPSRNVLTAQQYGCRIKKDNGTRFCAEPVIDVPNATMCEECFQTFYNGLMLKLNRYSCLNSGNGCLSEQNDYVPLPGIQSYTSPGCPGGAFKASGMFMLGYYCGACSMQNVALSADAAVMRNTVLQTKKRERSTIDEKIAELKEHPTLTFEQQHVLAQMEQTQERLEIRKKKLKEDEDALLETISTFSSIIVPTDDGD